MTESLNATITFIFLRSVDAARTLKLHNIFGNENFRFHSDYHRNLMTDAISLKHSLDDDGDDDGDNGDKKSS